jgi:cation diffusion facilitator CzcD-associated flavoprotein CzcO
MPEGAERKFDVIVIGGGQSGLAAAYYLKRSGLSFVILDKEHFGGGSWQHYWRSLHLFSPAQWSSLPGVLMPGGGNYYPERDEAIDYLRQYEARYNFPVRRNTTVTSVRKVRNSFIVETSTGVYRSRVIISATGSFSKPFIPHFEGSENFKGETIHSADYMSPDRFAGKRVAIVGEGNSGAQILAEVSQVTDTIWITQKEPRFLPDHVDGRFLFDAATQMYEAKMKGESFQPPSLGDIVMVSSVKDARARGIFKSVRPFERFSQNGLVWKDGHEELIDVVIFCTGFRPSIDYLQELNVINAEGRVDTIESRSVKQDGLWMIGYGNWTGFASATMIGVGRSAKKAVDEIVLYLSGPEEGSSIVDLVL